jgi:hypothetical protein
MNHNKLLGVALITVVAVATVYAIIRIKDCLDKFDDLDMCINEYNEYHGV